MNIREALGVCRTKPGSRASRTGWPRNFPGGMHSRVQLSWVCALDWRALACLPPREARFYMPPLYAKPEGSGVIFTDIGKILLERTDDDKHRLQLENYLPTVEDVEADDWVILDVDAWPALPEPNQPHSGFGQ